MSTSIIKAPAPADAALDGRRRTPQPAWSAAPPPGETSGGLPWARYFSALKRHKWLMLAIIVAGTAVGIAATRLLNPVYDVQATIWISTPEAPQREVRGPIRAEELVNPTAWIELFKSFAVVDAVVKRMSLHVALENWSDSLAFAAFTIDDRFAPGHYALTVDPSQRSYVLASDEGVEIERGTVGDSIGRTIGFRWAPAPERLRRGTIEFSVVNPRDVSVGLRDRVTTVLPERSNFLRITLPGADPTRTAAILNAWIEEFVATAAELKRRNLVDLAKVLEAQLGLADQGLTQAENALRSFQVQAITLPSAAAAGNGGGAESAPDPFMESYFRQKIEYEDVRHDRVVLQTTLADVQRGTLSPDALLSLSGVREGGDDLRTAVTDLRTRQSELRTARLTYTEEHGRVRELREAVAKLQDQTIPQIATALIDQLRRREENLGARIRESSQELRSIPNRTIEDMRLRRDVTLAEDLYTTLQNRYEEAKLAEASAVPDISILDAAVAPQWPTKDRASLVVFTAFLASVAAAAGIALLRDRVDRRLRYPEQAAHELGLDIIGAVPPIRAPVQEADPVETAQVIEAFRSVRVQVQQAFDSGPVLLTVSSPGVGDGKSLVSSKLALSFADAGIRTLLIDGDIRRGQQHEKFGIPGRPGLLDYLAGDAAMKDVVHAPSQPNLSIIPHGTKRERGPELLASEGMSHLIATLQTQYEAIIVDSPPLGANIDPFALGSTTGNMLLVLRSGETDRKVAEAKLKTLERFPIRVLGAVLNDFDLEGPYQQYSYLYGYGTLEDEGPEPSAPRGELTSRSPSGGP